MIKPGINRVKISVKTKLSQLSTGSENQSITYTLLIGEAMKTTKNKKKNKINICFFVILNLFGSEMKLSSFKMDKDTAPQHRPIISESAIFTGLSEIK